MVGHAFFWQLRANLYQPSSRERFYLLLERFLMCCGQFKNELFKQCLVDKALIRLSDFVEQKMEIEKESLKKTVELMHDMLKREEIKIKMMQQLVISHARFDDRKTRVDRGITDEQDKHVNN